MRRLAHHRWKRLTFIATVAGLGCGALLGCRPAGWVPEAARGPAVAEAPEVAARIDYTTTPTPGGIRGGERAQQLAHQVLRFFSNAELVPDGRLADVAARAAAAARERGGRALDPMQIDALARDRGVVGPCPLLILTPLQDGGWVALERHLASHPSNVRFTHFGVSVIESHGRVQGAVALGAQHLTLASIPRAVAGNDTLTFTGHVGPEYREPRWVWTLPDGSSREIPVATGNDISFTTEPLTAGVHRFEVFGVGPTGLEVLANFPVTAGVVDAQRDDGGPRVDETDPAAALVELINHARARAGAKGVARAALLDRIADAHSRDMTNAHFFGHESPTTGTLETRIGVSGVRVMRVGENVARAPSVSQAHRMLMDSPGHRQVMLTTAFTHVGIGISLDRSSSPPQMNITEVFGAFPEPLADPGGFAARLLERLDRLRAEANVPAVTRAAPLDRVAQSLAARFATDSNASAPGLADLLGPADAAHLRRREVRLLPLFPATPEEIQGTPDLLAPALRFVGIGVAQGEPTTDSPRTNVVIFVLET